MNETPNIPDARSSKGWLMLYATIDISDIVVGVWEGEAGPGQSVIKGGDDETIDIDQARAEGKAITTIRCRDAEEAADMRAACGDGAAARH